VLELVSENTFYAKYFLFIGNVCEYNFGVELYALLYCFRSIETL